MGGVVEGGLDRPRKVPRLYQGINGLCVLGLFLFLFVFGACSSKPRGEVETLEGRVKGFWEARVAGDNLKAYNYEAYAKTGKMTLQQYLRALSPVLKYTAYEVKRTVENGDEATVTVDFNYHLIVPARAELDLSTTIDERWVRIDGQWYRQVEQQDTKPTSG